MKVLLQFSSSQNLRNVGLVDKTRLQIELFDLLAGHVDQNGNGGQRNLDQLTSIVWSCGNLSEEQGTGCAVSGLSSI
jgi:hypothetical protein